jgi:hypothetical protein
MRNPTIDGMLAPERYLQVFNKADKFDLAEGLTSYVNYNQMMVRLADKYSFPLDRVVGAFVALPPNNNYEANLRSLVTLLWGMNAGYAEYDLPVTTYMQNKIKACDVLRGANLLDLARGLKVRSFYTNVLNPADRRTVTIDGHMVSIACGRYLRMSEAGVSGRRYIELCSAVIDVAQTVGLLPCQVQAVCWLTWKRLNQVYDPQLRLSFDGETVWRILRDVDSISPYKVRPRGLQDEPVKTRPVTA